jgi:hypothetical protein
MPAVDDGENVSLTTLSKSYGNGHLVRLFWLLVGIFYDKVTANDFIDTTC